jgi:hypothetical protein
MKKTGKIRGITKIGYGTFEGHTGLTFITIPEGKF